MVPYRGQSMRKFAQTRMLNTPPLSIDIVSDVVCPWCYVGKRRLEAALERRASDAQPVNVRWHAFQLNPDIPPSGVDRRSYLERKFGGPERAQQIYARIKAAGDEVGIAFDFDRIVRQPNTRDAHRLIAWAQSRGDADPLVERLFKAYFVEGRFIGAHEVLAEIAHEAGENADAAYAFLESDVGTTEIAEAEERAASLGITGVPFFIVDGRYGLSGAQPSEAIVEALRRARQPEAAD